MFWTRRTFPVALALSTTLAACVSRDVEPDARPVSTRIDSAGVEIVFTEVPLAGAPAFAELAAEPSLRLGSLAGAEEEQFGAIVDMAPLPDGGVAVLDQQAAQIRLFDSDGTYRGAVGSKGEGPGELVSPVNLATLLGDTLAVYDPRSRRVTLYPASGGDPAVRTLEGEGPSLPNRVSFFAEGGLVGSAPWFRTGGRGIPNEGEDMVSQDSAVIAVFSPEGALVDTAVVIPNREIIYKIMMVGQGINVLMSPTAFARSGVFAAHPDGVWAGFGERWELRLYDAATGALSRIARAPGLERDLTDQEMAAVHEAAMATDSTPAQRERRAVWWELSPRPEVRPTYDRLLVDDQGRLWLREWPGAGKDPQRWWVFQREGDLLGSVDVPTGVTLMAVSGADAWGVFRDELDVQYVVRYAMTVVEP